jgi:hypothetical protein
MADPECDVKMYLYSIRLEFRTEIEQRYMTSCHKGMKLPATAAEPAALNHEYAFEENRVKYWLHEIK